MQRANIYVTTVNIGSIACVGVCEEIYQKLANTSFEWNCLQCEILHFSDSFLTSHQTIPMTITKTSNLKTTTKPDKPILAKFWLLT